MDVKISIDGVERVRGSIDALILNADRKKLMTEIGYNVQERTADWLAQASISRHRTADRLGAQYTKILEFAPGRTRSLSKFKGRDKGSIHSENATERSVDIVFENTPALARAFGPVTITPRRARALTIPLHKVSYARTVGELRGEGHSIFHPRGTNILAENAPGKKKSLRPLYALVGRVTIRHDPQLLPDAATISEWAADTTEAFLELNG